MNAKVKNTYIHKVVEKSCKKLKTETKRLVREKKHKKIIKKTETFHLKSTLDSLFLKIRSELADLTSSGSKFHKLIARLKKLLVQTECLKL